MLKTNILIHIYIKRYGKEGKEEEEEEQEWLGVRRRERRPKTSNKSR